MLVKIKKRRRDVKIREFGKGRRFLATSMFESELKKLENSINYGDSVSRRGGREKFRHDVVPVVNDY